MASGAKHISIGFQGGQVLALRVEDGELKALNKVLGSGGWHDIHSEEGAVRLDLAQVVYVRAETEEPRVGFGA